MHFHADPTIKRSRRAHIRATVDDHHSRLVAKKSPIEMLMIASQRKYFAMYTSDEKSPKSIIHVIYGPIFAMMTIAHNINSIFDAVLSSAVRDSFCSWGRRMRFPVVFICAWVKSWSAWIVLEMSNGPIWPIVSSSSPTLSGGNQFSIAVVRTF